MVCGALLDLGVPLSVMSDSVARLGIAGLGVRRERVNRRGITATRFYVAHASNSRLRLFSETKQVITDARLAQPLYSRIMQCFWVLAKAESNIHGIPMDQVHFHELGALDTIADIVAACSGLQWLGLHRVGIGPIALGRGSIAVHHGNYPIPTPATLAILRGFFSVQDERQGELSTPTGATIARVFAKPSLTRPCGTVRKIGYGAGSRNPLDPNVLRLIVYTPC